MIKMEPKKFKSQNSKIILRMLLLVMCSVFQKVTFAQSVLNYDVVSIYITKHHDTPLVKYHLYDPIDPMFSNAVKMAAILDHTDKSMYTPEDQVRMALEIAKANQIAETIQSNAEQNGNYERSAAVYKMKALESSGKEAQTEQVQRTMNGIPVFTLPAPIDATSK